MSHAGTVINADMLGRLYRLRNEMVAALAKHQKATEGAFCLPRDFNVLNVRQLSKLLMP